MKRKLLAVVCLMGFTNFINTTSPQQPTLARVYADPFVPAVAQSNSPGTVGTLNNSFGTNGSLNLSAQLAGSSASAVRTLADGSVFVLLDNGTDSVVAKYTATGVLDTMFNSPTGYQTLEGLTSAYFIELDSAGNILVGGDNDDGGSSPFTNGWMVRITPAGVLDTQFNNNFAAAGTWDFPGAFAQQTSGRYIIAGRSPLYTQLGAFNIDGTVDTTFGNNGYVIFDGNGSAPEGQTFPISVYGVMDIAIASDDSIFVGYRNDNSTQVALAKFDANGLLVRNLLNALGGTIKEIQIRVGLTAAGDIIVAGTLIDYTIGIICWPVDFSASIFSCIIPSTSGNQVQIADVVTLSNGYFAVLSSDLTNNSMRIDQFQVDGSIDTNFNANGTAGYIEFNPAVGSGEDLVSALLYRGAVSQDGQLYLSGVQTTQDGGSIVSPYLSKLYDYQYVLQVPQYPATNEQGQFDTTFGPAQSTSVDGVPFLYNGNFGQMMQQKARAIIQQINSGALLIGGDGFTDSTDVQTMMLTQLNAYGNYDTGFGNGGKLLLPNVTSTNESLVSLIQGSSTDLYVAGTSDDDGAFLRSYYGATPAGAPPAHYAGDTIWNATPEGSNTSAVGLALQRTPRALLFVADSASGHISAYQITGGSAGAIDTTFNAGSGHAGYIQTADFGLNMGPVYGGGVVNHVGNIFIAYKSTVSPYYINVAAIKADGSGLVKQFANDHTVHGIFDHVFGNLDTGGIIATNVRIALTHDQNIMVTAVNATNSQCLITVLDGVTGNRDLNFNGGDVVSIHVDSNNDISLSSLTCLSDGSAMITGFDNSSKQMFTFRITQDGTLDETFNPQGIQPGVLIFTVTDQGADYDARCVTGLLIESMSNDHGDIILTAYEQQTETQSTPEVMRVFGQPGTTQVARFPNVDQYEGTLDVGLNGNGAITLNGTPYAVGQETIDISAGMGKVVFTYPLDNEHEGKLLVGIDNGTTSLLARVYATNMTLDDTFGQDLEGGIHSGIYTLATGLSGIDCISIDANNNILIGGANLSSTPHSIWAQQVSDDGTSAISFEIPSIIIGINQIYQQKSGRYIVACRDSSNRGYLLAYQNQLVDANETLQLDQTFNPLGTIPGNPSSTLQPGYFVFEPTTGGLFNLVINNDDTILVAYLDTTIQIAKIYADGSGLVDGSGFAGFGTDGVVSTGITPDAASVIRLVITAQGRIVVAASCGSGTNVQVARYSSLGIFDSGAWNSGNITTITGIGDAGVTLTDLIETATGQTILTGFNSSGANGKLFAARLTSAGILDTTWNPDVTPGILTSDVDDVTSVYDAAIGINGDVYVIGGNVVDINTPIVPLLMRIIGANYIPAAAQAPLAAPAGTLDYTINQPLPLLGALDIGYSTGVDPNKLYMYPNGSMLIASNENGIPSYVSKLDATLAIDTDFGNSTSYLQFDSISYINDMFVSDATGQPGFIYITGQNTSSEMISAKILPDGSDYTILATLDGWEPGRVIREMMTGDILVAGYNGTYGALALYTSNCLGLNPLFGNQTPQNGTYLTNSPYPISAMTVDEFDRIYIAYKNSSDGTLSIQRLLANGSGVDPYFVSVSIAPASGYQFDSQQILLSLDINNNQLAIAAGASTDESSYCNMYRFSTIDGSATGSVTMNIRELSSLFFDTNQNIYVIGLKNTLHITIARIQSVDATTIAFDDTYGTNGIANIASTLYGARSGAIDPDGRVYVVGDNNRGTVPYMARIFGDNYYTQVSQALDAIVPGDFDYTYGYDGVAQTYANGATDASANQQVKAISQFPAGTNIMSVVGDGIKSWTVQLLADGTNDPAYNLGEGIEITKLAGNETVNGMIFDGVGNMIVFGSNDEQGGYVKSLLPTGQMNPTFGGYTGNATTALHPFGSVYGLMTTVNAVAQLNNGKLVVVGNNNGVGTVMMLSPTGVPLPEFGTNGSVISGLDITSVSVDADNNLYLCVGYLYDDSVVSFNAIRFLKLTASGSQLLSIDNVLTGINNQGYNRLIFNEQGKIIIAASGLRDSGLIVVTQLNADGSLDYGFNNGYVIFLQFARETDAVVSKLIALNSGKILLAAYQFDSGFDEENDPEEFLENKNFELVVCLTASGELDETFNSEGAIPGILQFKVEQIEPVICRLFDMNIQYDGQILLAGSEDMLSFDPESDNIPLSIRLQGYENIRAVAQFPGFSPSVENRLNQLYGDAGVAKSDPVEYLVGGGDIAIDSQGRSIVVGTKTTDDYTSFVVTRFLSTGLPDPNFGINGIVESTVFTFYDLSEYSYVAVDSHDDIIVAAVTSNSTFVLIKFSGVDGLQDMTFGGDGGGQSTVIANLQLQGGYLAIDTLDKILVGGYTSDFNLVVARFTSDGLLDTAGFAAGTGIAIVNIPYLLGGGYVTTDGYDNVYVGGATLANTMVVAKFTSAGILEASYSNPTGFGTNGIAETPAISGLLGGGSVALDQFGAVVVGGYTSNQTFVVAKFLSSGSVDSLFGTNGIAYTNPLGVDIHLFGDIAVDSNNSIVIGGITAQHSVPMSMSRFPVGFGKFVVARWLQNGDIDATFSSTGFALSRTIAGLTKGGFVGTDVFDHILVGGFGPQYLYSGPNGILRVAEFLSGEEIFVNNPGGLTPADYKIFWYGNNPELFKDFLAVEFYARVITDQTARETTLLAVLNIVDNYATVYQNQPGWNLIWHLYKIYKHLNNAQGVLIGLYPGSSDEIITFFENFEGRIGALTGKFPAAG